MSHRAAGVLLHPTSLSGPYGVGDFGPRAERFLAWASDAGLRLWQVLPLFPAGAGNSPYSARSTFAGNPLLISPERLVEDGLLDEDDLAPPEQPSGGPVDYLAAWQWKEPRLRRAWRRFRDAPPPAVQRHFERFVAEQAAATGHAAWLEDWLAYTCLARRFEGRSWVDWPAPLRDREPAALKAVRRELAGEIAFERFLQFLVFDQWRRVRRVAAEAGIRLIGDLPIYVALDSADVWAHRELFELDANGRPLAVAGVPPDYFNAEGQLWGNPLYRWDRMADDGFAWSIERVRAALRMTDLVRLDHFRGFEAYWRVPAGEERISATEGSWVPGPGKALFDALRQALGTLPLLAEDLGELTPAVHRLRAEVGLPSMKVLQFAFGEADSEHLPQHWSSGDVVYTGTHDNDTLRGWFEQAPANEQRHALDLAQCEREQVAWEFIRVVYHSTAERIVVPMQDFLNLGSAARMNTPGTQLGNWRWRLVEGALTRELAGKLRQLAEESGRWTESVEKIK